WRRDERCPSDKRFHGQSTGAASFAWRRSRHAAGCATFTPCTAVTLYSGQFVAQSEFSVVMRFAPDSGKWNVVYTTPTATLSVIYTRRAVSPARLVTPTQSP